MIHTKTRYVYGPVPSRRLGRSLGLDLVPFKTCTYDCIYCQLGRTTNLTLERKAYVTAEILVNQCRQTLESKPKPDTICLAGSGEPTLNSAIGEVIRGIKRVTDVPVAVLTNGALLWQPDVQEALLAADLVMPSLDAGDASMFQQINRPHPELLYGKMIAGLRAFTERFRGQVWLEVLLVADMSGIQQEVDKIAARVNRIQPGRVQLNTVCRPPAEAEAHPVSREAMQRFAGCFAVPVDIVGQAVSGTAAMASADQDLGDDILAMIARRPCTAQDVARGLGVHINEALKYLEALAESRKLERIVRDRRTFFTIPSRN